MSDSHEVSHFDGSSGLHSNILPFDDLKLNHVKDLQTKRYNFLFSGSCTFDFGSLYFRSDSKLQRSDQFPSPDIIIILSILSEKNSIDQWE